jgi:hypothetical protein
VPIGIIPAGSGNTWAFDLGLAGAEDAASIIVNGQTAAVDVMASGPPSEAYGSPLSSTRQRSVRAGGPDSDRDGAD